MAYEFTITRQVEFSDTDMAGIMHYANFFRFMESAEHAFYRSLGFSVHGHGPEGAYGFPRVHAECDYLAPLKFEDQVEVHLLVADKGTSSVTYEFTFRKAGHAAAVARGKLVVVYVTSAHGSAPGGKMTKAALPPELDSQIEIAPQRLLHTRTSV